MPTNYDKAVEARLLRYVQIDTTSNEASPTTPSTERQFALLNLLARELTALGLTDVTQTDYGAVIATVPGTSALPTIAFCAHVDTTEAYSGSGVTPRVHRAYAGDEITFPNDPALRLSPATNRYLGERIGDDIITASGGTLLGADDKAGVAIVMTLAEALLVAPDDAHGPVRVCFTPDEEIGRGVHPQLPTDLNATCAYTLDGGQRGEIVYETFSADKATVTITGVSTHPGSAKGTMVNALHLAAKILTTLPATTRTPDTTDGRDGFIHAYSIQGGAAEATIEFILRDFEQDGLASHGELLRQICETIAATEPRATITCEIQPQYRNMRYWLEHDMRPVNIARDAAHALGLEAHSSPTRGGTDGSQLTERGLPTPNLFTGMQDIHGPLEWISVQDMSLAVSLCREIVQRWAQA